ncbi:hypothetical protein [Cyclobacterium sp.]|uniref:hypothetical protein n=1 Tax=Cyclobacterium sp. TaxID=1966343 RepID=UPI0019BA4D5B|nr:hypothetical protein [Cyclobacterium sp.]MBD3629471.1 hypothetical protein [Cyclobacterium sp.]
MKPKNFQSSTRMQVKRKDTLNCFLLATLTLFSLGCSFKRVSRELVQVEEIKLNSQNNEYLKVHMQNGDVYIFHSWKVDKPNEIIFGFGNHLDYNRNLIETRGGTGLSPSESERIHTQFLIPFDEIVILETNQKGNNPGVAAMVLVGLTTGAFSLYCSINPKACFGSCPTFYVSGLDVQNLVGEGFSSSISKSFEDTDIDLIDLNMEDGAPLQLILKNEALETHLVNKVNLLSLRKNEVNRVFQSSNGDFHEVKDIENPLKATYHSQLITDFVATKDDKEWFSLADTFNLLKKETLFLEFSNPGVSSGLIIEKRQTLMTTFLFYHFFSLMGNASSHYLAGMETSEPGLSKKVRAFQELLGGIEVFYLNDKGNWIFLDKIAEDGPIVTDSHLVTLPLLDTPIIKIKLKLNQGLWRINTLNLAVLERKVAPEIHVPLQVKSNTTNLADTVALSKLKGDGYLVTFPGEAYTLDYGITYRKDREYFVESKGYYIEWMREEWLEDQNLQGARRAMLHPEKFLKEMALPFKAIEPKMEEIFWNTRISGNGTPGNDY